MHTFIAGELYIYDEALNVRADVHGMENGEVLLGEVDGKNRILRRRRGQNYSLFFEIL